MMTLSPNKTTIRIDIFMMIFLVMLCCLCLLFFIFGLLAITLTPLFRQSGWESSKIHNFTASNVRCPAILFVVIFSIQSPMQSSIKSSGQIVNSFLKILINVISCFDSFLLFKIYIIKLAYYRNGAGPILFFRLSGPYDKRQ